MKLLGIHGFKQSGKDTFARMVLKRFPQMQLIAFADKLKEMCAVTFDVPLWVFYDNSLKELPYSDTGMSPREMMISFSDLVKSHFGKAFFLEPIERKWHEVTETGLIVTDVRYEIEAYWLRELGGQIVHIKRPGVHASAHSSEQGLSVAAQDYVVNNGGTLDDLDHHAETFCKWWVGPVAGDDFG